MAVLMAKGQRATSQARGSWGEEGVSGGGPVSALTVSLQNPFLWERTPAPLKKELREFKVWKNHHDSEFYFKRTK